MRHARFAALIVAMAVSTLMASTAGSGAAGRDFDNPTSHDTGQQFATGNVQRQDTPNDPEFDQAEPDDPEGATVTDLYAERFDLFGFPSQLTRNTAIYKEGPNAGQPVVSGFNAAGAWKQTRGDSSVFIAILDTGVKWNRAGLRNKIHLNRGELPPPQDASGKTHPSAALGGYDLNGSGVLDVDDYAADPRVLKVKPAGQAKIAGLELIHVFSDGRDADGNGFVDDIAGWNFFDNTNDPTDRSSYFAAENHGSGRAEEAVEEGNEGSGSIGVCPKCQFMPVRTWDTFVSDGNTFGMGILFATISGASVIEGANGSVYHSAFTEAASEYAYQHGVVQTFSGDDLNTANHNYPANYGHVMLIQGTAPDTQTLSYDFGPEGKQLITTLGVPVGSEIPTMTYFRGANTTQFGGKSSIAMTGGTGSENTGKASGAAGLVISAARQHGIALRPDETRAILEQTAEDITAGNTIGVGLPDFAQEGWDPHFGWGRVNLGKAVSSALSTATIPPEGAIYAPDWYAPLTGASVHVTGLARARFASGGQFHYRVEWGAGQAPTSWTKVKEGYASGSLTDLGTIDLASVRSALASFTPPTDLGGPVYSPTSPHPLASEFTVRLTVTAAGQGRVAGIDRRVFSIVDDSTLLAGYPKKMGSGGEAPIRFADLEGDGIQELIVPTEDGTVHAYRPDGSELPGWPVHTGLLWPISGHESAPGFKDVLKTAPPREPPRAPAIADLDGDGTLELVTAAGTHVYVWEPNGKLRAGFPVSSSFSYCGPSLQSQPLRHPKCGFLASPSLARLEGGTTLDIVQPALDGHLYAWRPDGTAVPGYPIALVDPSVPADQRMIAESINEPAIGELDGDGKDDIVVADNEEYGATMAPGDLAGLLAQGISDLAAQALGGSTRVYAINGETGRIMAGWPIKLNGAIQSTLPFIGPGHNPSIVNLSGQPVVVVSSTGGSLAEYGVDGTELRAAQQTPGVGANSNATDKAGGLNLFESAAIGDILGTGTPALVKYELSLGGVANLALAGQNFPYNHLIGAWDAGTGAPLPAFPTITDDFQFLSSSTVVKAVPGSTNQIVAGTGLGLLHAYDGLTGQDVAGFPKRTGGWLFSPAAFSDDGRVAEITREGFLFVWKTEAPACQTEWPSWRHDQQGSGNYNRDGTPPGAPRGIKLTPLGGDRYQLSFGAPGDDGYCGAPAKYVSRVDGRVVDLGLGGPAAGGSAYTREVNLPKGVRSIRVHAVDEAGNSGPGAAIDMVVAAPVGGARHLPATGSNQTSIGIALWLVAAAFGFGALVRRRSGSLGGV